LGVPRSRASFLRPIGFANSEQALALDVAAIKTGPGWAMAHPGKHATALFSNGN
jgi:hypothetical protein